MFDHGCKSRLKIALRAGGQHLQVLPRCPFLPPIADGECGAFMSTRPN
jgi:hypothetical protein